MSNQILEYTNKAVWFGESYRYSMSNSAGGGAADSGDERTVRLSVPEMDCPSCAETVESGLDRLEGVVGVETRTVAGTVLVTHDPARVDRESVVDTLETAGYEVANAGEADDSETTPPSEVWTSVRAYRTWFGGAFLLGGLFVQFLLSGANQTLLSTPVELVVADLGYLVAVLASGVPVVRSGYRSVRARSLDIDLLMGTAILAAMAVGLYVEAATLAVLFSVAELLEAYAMDRTRDSLRELLALAPEEATVLRDGEELAVPVEALEVGDTVVVRPGEKVPVDGVVREGSSALDQSPITGESVPVDKSAGEEVYAGTLNQAGYLELEATTTADETTLSQIIDLVRAAEAKPTDSEQFVDRFASYYTPVVVVLAVTTAAVPPLLIGDTATLGLAGYTATFTGVWETWFVRGLTLLVIACPCAFVISTPVSVASGVTSAARNGVLVKGGNHLETMGDIDAIALDKTGTLTKGELAVTDVEPVADVSREQLLRLAGAIERRSEHPIADAVLAAAPDDSLPSVDSFEPLTGTGVRARIDGETHYAGKPALFERFGLEVGHSEPDTRNGGPEPSTDGGVVAGASQLNERVRSLEAAGKTVVAVGTEDRLLGVLGIADEIRPGAHVAVENLRRLGVDQLVLLTGDNEGTARAVAEALDIEYRADLLPEEKVEALEGLAAEHGTVAMVGDGINDAPALATASVGVAMGAAGTDTAIETADIALMGDDVTKLPYLYALSGRTNRVIRQNVWSSLGVKLLLAVGVPFGYVTVAVAILVGDMGMSLGVTGNAMGLSRVEPDDFLE